MPQPWRIVIKIDTLFEFLQALRVSMEEQRQRQDEGSTQVTEASKEDAVSAPTPAAAVPDAAGPDDDAMLRNALSMSLGGVSLITVIRG